MYYSWRGQYQSDVKCVSSSESEKTPLFLCSFSSTVELRQMGIDVIGSVFEDSSEEESPSLLNVATLFEKQKGEKRGTERFSEVEGRQKEERVVERGGGGGEGGGGGGGEGGGGGAEGGRGGKGEGGGGGGVECGLEQDMTEVTEHLLKEECGPSLRIPQAEVATWYNCACTTYMYMTMT